MRGGAAREASVLFDVAHPRASFRIAREGCREIKPMASNCEGEVEKSARLAVPGLVLEMEELQSEGGWGVGRARDVCL